MARRGRGVRTLLCGLALCAGLGSVRAQESAPPAPPESVSFTTPDGTRFVLLPTKGPPVIHWVIATPAGWTEDPEGLDGLAVAVARASLAGTTRVGSRNRATEEDVLARIEENERRRLLLQRAGQEVPESLLRTLQADKTQAEVVADRLAWERTLRRVPAGPSRLGRLPTATLLALSLPTGAVDRVAALLLARREEPMLRGLFDELRGVRTELVAEVDAWTPLRDEVRSLAFSTHAAGRPSVTDVEAFEPVGRAAAMDVFVRTQRPERAVHVLTGGFAVEPVAKTLVRAFASSSLSRDPFVPPASPPEPRPRTSELADGTLAGLAIGLRVPPNADPDAVALAVAWLAGGEHSFLARWLFAQKVRTGALRATFPAGGVWPHALAVIEIAADERDASDRERTKRLWTEVEAGLERAARDGPLPEELQLVRADLMAQRAPSLLSPDRLAAFVAVRCATLGMSSGQALRPLEATTDAAVTTALRALLAPQRRVRVTQELAVRGQGSGVEDR